MPPKTTVPEADRLIYEKSNKYRLHADNLRWSLLGGYAAFFAAAATLVASNGDAPTIAKALVNLLLFAVSLCYLLVLAVQNWFYNLFAKYVKQCEDRLVKGRRLQPLEAFAVQEGKDVNPFHPAFFFAELVVGITSSYFAYSALTQLLGSFLAEWWAALEPLLKLPVQCLVSFVLLIAFALYLYVLNAILFRHWNTVVYNGLIVKFSNLWQPVSNDKSKRAA